MCFAALFVWDLISHIADSISYEEENPAINPSINSGQVGAGTTVRNNPLQCKGLMKISGEEEDYEGEGAEECAGAGGTFCKRLILGGLNPF